MMDKSKFKAWISISNLTFANPAVNAKQSAKEH